MNEKSFLPLGSIVRLKGGTRKLVIIRINQHATDKDNKVHDYIGVLYPYGFDDYEKTLIFDKEIIKKVHHI